MITWFKPKTIESNEYVALSKRITQLELDVFALTSFQDNIRNMARKIQTRKSKEQEDETPEDIKGSVLIAT